MKLHRDFKEFLSLLLSHQVRFLVIGAHALAVHGRPRYTGDLDIFIDPTKANAKRLLLALSEFGFGGVGLRVEDFITPDRVAQLGYPPVRIDILTAISGVTFAQAWRGRKVSRIGTLELVFIGASEFMINKRASGRPKDLADIALLEESLAGKPASPPPKPHRPRRP